MAKIDWDFARKAPRWTIEEFCEFIHPNVPSAQEKLDKLVRRAIGAKELRGDVVRRPGLFLAGTPEWKQYLIYLIPAEALAWAREKGETIPPELAGIESPLRAADETQPTTTFAPDNEPAAKRKAPDVFIAALIRLLVEISKRAAKKGMPFDPDAMPGTKADFRELAIKFDDRLDKGGRTFDDYLAGLVRFKLGARQMPFYQDLFPEYFAPTKGPSPSH
jgi:hypothetical protein